jgi:hypothetical protein
LCPAANNEGILGLATPFEPGAPERLRERRHVSFEARLSAATNADKSIKMNRL